MNRWSALLPSTADIPIVLEIPAHLRTALPIQSACVAGNFEGRPLTLYASGSQCRRDAAGERGQRLVRPRAETVVRSVLKKLVFLVSA